MFAWSRQAPKCKESEHRGEVCLTFKACRYRLLQRLFGSFTFRFSIALFLRKRSQAGIPPSVKSCCPLLPKKTTICCSLIARRYLRACFTIHSQRQPLLNYSRAKLEVPPAHTHWWEETPRRWRRTLWREKYKKFWKLQLLVFNCEQ